MLPRYSIHIFLTNSFIWFSFCGYADGFGFRKIDDTVIDFVQNFVRNSLQKRLSEKCARWQIELHQNDKEHFFGMFQDCIEEFEIMPGERTILLSIAQFLNKLFEDEGFDDFVDHFRPPSGYRIGKRNTDQFAVGLFFGRKNRQPSKCSQPTMFNIEDASSNLFLKLNKFLEPFSKKLHTVRSLKNDIIKITDLKPGFRADVICIFCIGNDSECEPLLKSLAIQNDSKREGVYHWNFSNFRKHIKWHIAQANKADNLDKSVEPIIQDNKTENISIGNLFNPNELIVVSDGIDNFDIDQSHFDVEQSQFVAEQNANGLSANAIERESEYLTVFDDSDSQLMDISNIGNDKSLKDIMIRQFSDQNLLVNESVLLNHGDKMKKRMVVNIDNQSASVKVVEIRGDGNCLFGSLVAQLNDDHINTSEFDSRVEKLRQNVVDYIRNNKDRFQHVIKGRILYEADEAAQKSDNINEKIDYFIENKLNRNNYWGGTETIVAASEMFNVNILIFSENNTAYLPNGFKPEYGRTVFLAYRLSKESTTKPVYNHYDSICDIPVDVIYKLACKFGQSLNNNNYLV